MFNRYAGIALGLVLLVAFAFAREYRYLFHGVATNATIQDVENRLVAYSQGDSGVPGHEVYERRVFYEYQDAEGVKHQGSLEEDAPSMALFQPGSTIRIQYLSNAPSVSRIEPSWWSANWGLLVVALAGGFGVIALAIWWTGQDSLAGLVRRFGNWSAPLPFKSQRRARMLREPFPYAWLGYLRKNVALHAHLTPAEQEKLHADLRIFLAEKDWEGCSGQVITDEIRVTISAQACVLLLGIEHDYFSQVKSILVYPTAFAIPGEHPGPDGLVHEGIGALGQAWPRGPVILAWDDVLAGGRNDHDGRNVVFHEFAHQLDFLGEWSSHKGIAASREEREKWQKVMHGAYEQLVRDAEHGKATLLDKYGATNPAEFFAVATECFFEQPVKMLHRHPELYEVLQVFYGQDAAKRFGHRPAHVARPES